MIKLGFFAATLGGIAYAYGTLFERHWPQVNHVPLTVTGLASTLDGLRIVQISDLHVSSSEDVRFLRQIVDQVNALQPDIVAITGDFVTHQKPSELDQIGDVLTQLSARYGVYAVPGNHDYRGGGKRAPNTIIQGSIEQVRAMLTRANIQDLSNRACTIAIDNAQLTLAGVDDVWARRSRLDQLLPQLPDDNQPVILLAHEPDFADIAAATGRFTLQLSGHTHGGQVRAPFIGALTGVTHGMRYIMGLYDLETMKLYVNRGIGTVGLPVRFLCRPEIALITLHPAG